MTNDKHATTIDNTATIRYNIKTFLFKVVCTYLHIHRPERTIIHIKRLEEAGFENVELSDDLDRPHIYKAYTGECIVYAIDAKSLGESNYYGQHIRVERHNDEISETTAQKVFDRYPNY